MKTSLICACLALGLASPSLQAQSSAQAKREARQQAALTAQMFYQLLLGEMNAAQGDTGAAISLLLDAARKTGDEQIFKRAADLALGARAGDVALQVARTWRQALPRSLEANRYLMQILVALNRVGETIEPLKAVIELTPQAERKQLIEVLPALYGRASDRKLASTVVEQALADALADAQTGALAWTTVARLRAGASEPDAAVEALQRAQAVDAQTPQTALLAAELMDARRPQAEALVRNYLSQAAPAAPDVRMTYARNLMEMQRLADAQVQLDLLTREQPDYADAWLLMGSLQMDSARPALAEDALKRYLALTQPQIARHQRGRTQAQLMLAQLSEKRGDLAAAELWLDMGSSVELGLQVQSRRALLLARRGQVEQARELIRKWPEREPGDARAKLVAEAQLLRELKQYPAAYELLAQASKAAPQDTDLLYEQALMAEKLDRLDEMETLLRRIVQLKPEHPAAYNALGYSLADRGVRLQEARQLILKALEFTPNDPFIQDSLAWVEFRLGKREEALRIIEAAFKARPDAEIAAHFGEILWSLNQRDRALAIWREGLQLGADNETLRETLKRLGARP